MDIHVVSSRLKTVYADRSTKTENPLTIALVLPCWIISFPGRIVKSKNQTTHGGSKEHRQMQAV